ncbi:MAG: small ribosomal subunit Rsm22 family protein [Hyphomonadaceae bacterium]|nr:small ribosomal subunit Rsm22 family protein [Hyphomonadaceae bacterium]
MELPPRLRQAVESALEGVPLSELAAAAEALSQRYRNEVRDGRLHLNNEHSALAYLATRMPATYAAIHASLSAIAEALPGFAPSTTLDVGAGPGTALWAAHAVWSGLEEAELIETSPSIRAWGEKLSASSGVPRISWRAADLRSDLGGKSRDLVTLAYVLDELASAERGDLVDRLWRLASGVLLIVEPGTPKGWERILAARTRLIAAGASIVAPCPHAAACPLVAPDWCHFSARVARSRIHRLAKNAEVPWEDEKYIYLAASRMPAAAHAARIIAPPEPGSGRVRLKLCNPDGPATHRLVTRREGDTFKRARRSDWGDRFEG